MNRTVPFLWLIFLICFYKNVSAQHPRLIIPAGHMFQVEGAFFSANDKYVITHAENIKIWETASGKLLKNIDFKFRPKDVYLFNNNEILAASYPDSVRFWNIKEDRLIKTIAGTNFNINEKSQSLIVMDYDDNDLSKTQKARLYELPDFRFLHEFQNPVASAGDNKTFVTVDLNNINIYDASYQLLYHSSGGNIAGISKDFRFLAIQYEDYIKIVDTYAKQVLQELQTDKLSSYSVRFIPEKDIMLLKVVPRKSDGGYVVQNGNTYFLSMDLKQFTVLNKFPEQQGNLADWTYNNDIVAASFTDSTIRVWDIKSGKLLNVFHDSTGHSSYISFSDSYRFIIASSNTSSAKIWDTATNSLQFQLEENTSYLSTLHFSEDRKLGLFQRNNDVWVWNIAKGKPLIVVSPEKNRNTYDCFIDSNNRHLYTITKENTKTKLGIGNTFSFNPDDSQYYRLAVYNIQNGQEQLTMPLPEKFFRHAISPSGEILIAGLKDSTFLAYNTHTGSVIKRPERLNATPDDISFLPGGNQFILVSDEKLAIYDSRTFTPVFHSTEKSSITSYGYHALTGNMVIMLNNKRLVIRNTKNPGLKKELSIFEEGNTNIVFTKVAYKILFDHTGRYACIQSIKDSAVIVLDTETGATDKSIPLQTFTTDFTFDNNNHLLLFSKGGELIEWDLLQQHKIRADHYDIEYIKDIQMNGAYMLGNTNTEIKILDAKTKKTKYSIFLFTNSNYVVTDPGQRYDGTEAARKELYFTCGTEIIDLDQVKDQLWIPGLAERVMKNETIQSKNMDDLGICSLTPVIEEINNSENSYHFKIIPRRGNLGETVLYINGIEVKRLKKTQLRFEAGAYHLEISKKQLAGYFIAGQENPVLVKSWIADNSISSRGLIIKEDKTKENPVPPNLYAVMVGVSDYKGDELDLKYAAKDAGDISGALSLAARKLLNTDGKEHVFMYNLTTTSDHYLLPEKMSIQKTLEEIGTKATANDILLIFFAGHGVMAGTEKKQFYFLTSDASNATAAGATSDVGISTTELTEWMKPENIKAQKRIMILDACNSGQAIRDFVQIGSKEQGYIAARNDEKSQQVKAIEKLNNQSGLIILAASASDQNAYEMGRYSQGLLTYSLLTVMKQQPEILDDGKYLDVNNWLNAAKKMVSSLAEATGARQEPQLSSNNNFNIGLIDNDVRSKIVLASEKRLFTRSILLNADTKIDNLKLRNRLDKELQRISNHGNNSPITYSADYEGEDAYALTGDYKITENDILVSMLIVKGGTEIKQRFEIPGKVSAIEALVNAISDKVLGWIKTGK